jgi:hypothetical protein
MDTLLFNVNGFVHAIQTIARLYPWTVAILLCGAIVATWIGIETLESAAELSRVRARHERVLERLKAQDKLNVSIYRHLTDITHDLSEKHDVLVGINKTIKRRRRTHSASDDRAPFQEPTVRFTFPGSANPDPVPSFTFGIAPDRDGYVNIQPDSVFTHSNPYKSIGVE